MEKTPLTLSNAYEAIMQCVVSVRTYGRIIKSETSLIRSSSSCVSLLSI